MGGRLGRGLGTWQSLGISGSLRPGKRSIFNCYCQHGTHGSGACTKISHLFRILVFFSFSSLHPPPALPHLPLCGVEAAGGEGGASEVIEGACLSLHARTARAGGVGCLQAGVRVPGILTSCWSQVKFQPQFTAPPPPLPHPLQSKLSKKCHFYQTSIQILSTLLSALYSRRSNLIQWRSDSQSVFEFQSSMNFIFLLRHLWTFWTKL